MNFALIGCGRISKNHIASALKNNLKIVALCDIDLGKIKELLSKFNISYENDIKIYSDYKEMIQMNDINIISIATESGKHAEIAFYCINHKIHTIIEKPIALDLRDADKIIELSKANNVKVTVAFQNRFNIAIKNVRDALKKNLLGKLSHGSINVRWNRNTSYYDQAGWRGTWEQDGGALMNQSIHGIDLLCWSFDYDIDEIYGYTRNRYHQYIDTEDLGVSIVKFHSGALGIIEGSVNIYPKNLEETLCIFGEHGTIKISGKNANIVEIWDIEGFSDSLAGVKEESSDVYGHGHILLFNDFIEAIKFDRDPLITALDGRKALEVVLAIYLSQKSGKSIKFPLNDFSTLMMKGEKLL